MGSGGAEATCAKADLPDGSARKAKANDELESVVDQEGVVWRHWYGRDLRVRPSDDEIDEIAGAGLAGGANAHTDGE